LWDWSLLQDVGKRAENFIASHLLKAVHYWNDAGFGEYDLFYIRDKDKREVDFLVTKEQEPWLLVEVKNSSNHSINENLYRFQRQTKAPHAFQVVFDMDFQEIDCFSYHTPIIVSAKTLLAQLF
jgi:predicted AAA+ superfamily ATPase